MPSTKLPTIDLVNLQPVTGGATSALPVYPNMGAPKYSAAWWDFVRARGLQK